MKNALLLITLLIGGTMFAQSSMPGFTKFTLENGLTVYLWEDHNQPNVSGSVVVRAGAVDEPQEFTGMAHYLEHLLFKGTQTIGAMDWTQEKPHYDKIIQLYDELAATTDPVKRDTLTQQINRESLAAAQFSNTTEFSNLVEGIGGEGLNAGTSYDYTVYLNSFPAFQMAKWLDIYTERLINPVFRSFQAELENVYEEYNLYNDYNQTHINSFLISNIYKGSPYAHDIVGFPEQLKNPRISKLIEFYNTWYVPGNMALVLVGNFDTQQTIPLIKEKFSHLKAAPVPERKVYADADFAGNQKYSSKIADYPQLYLAYKGVKVGSPDELLLEFCANLLNNSMKTGLLDKLNLNGDVQYANAQIDSRRSLGRLMIEAVPYYDVNQKIYESDKATEKTIMTEVEKLKNGQIEDWLFESVKKNLIQQTQLIFETPAYKSGILQHMFSYQLPDDYYSSMSERVSAITKEDVKRIAKQYFSTEHITVSFDEGTPKKNKIKKPEIKPIEPPKGKISDYAKAFKAMPVSVVKEDFNNFSDVNTVKLYDDVTLNYNNNAQNDIFTLTMRFGVGTKRMPKLKYATTLINSAGIMPSDDAQAVRRQFSELNAMCQFRTDANYFYIDLSGEEKNLEEACKLMTRLALLPKLDNKQLNRVKGSEYMTRMVEQKDVNQLGDALYNYILYKDSSSYINRMKFMSVYYSSLSELTGEISRATDYEATLYYVGKKPIAEVSEILKANLPLKEGLKKTESPIVMTKQKYDKSQIYFLPNSDMQQAKVYFYIPGFDYKIADEVTINAFEQYFSGSFNGLVMQEIRENNSLAYTAYGGIYTPPIQGKQTYYKGYVGTQNDKVARAVDLYLKLLQDMPLYPERIDNIKIYLRAAYLSAKPSFRDKSEFFDAWKLLGYTDDPAKTALPEIDKLTFDQIVNFYNQNIKGKPVVVVIMGDPKLIDLKQIQTNQGKVTRLSTSTIFSKDDEI